MLNFLLILFGKLVSFVSKKLNKGNGSTWPGEIALKGNPFFLKNLISKNHSLKIILIAGTNGKTTTSMFIYEILKIAGYKVFRNESGANLLNGIVSSLINHSNLMGGINYDFAILEVDENNLPFILDNLNPIRIVLLNLFRDQLDRYGEINSIAKKWKVSFEKLPKEVSFILNADDVLISYLGKDIFAPVSYFGLDPKDMQEKELSPAADSIYCPKCSAKLIFKKIAYSHLGDWQCLKCGLKKPAQNFTFKISNFQLCGIYNKYNALAAVTCAETLGISEAVIKEGLSFVKPAFGRQEKIFVGKKIVQLFLAKNPTGFNESLRAIVALGAKYIMIVLNDRIPDGRDISWIWDIDFEKYLRRGDIFVSGDRAYDMSIRLKYADQKVKVATFVSLTEGIKKALDKVSANETLYILPTYSAMLEIRKILTGRKIL